MRFTKIYFKLLICMITLISGCGGNNNSTNHVKVEAFFGIMISHANFKTLDETVNWMHSLGISTYSIECGRIPTFGTGQEPSYYIEFEIDSFNLAKATASGDFFPSNTIETSHLRAPFPCG